MPNFTHLHVHTEYSLLDGSSKIKEITKHAAELGMNSLAITDHGVMYGVIDFYEAARSNGIKPIIGCEIYVSPGSRFDKGKQSGEGKYNHLILLAENNQGYQNLMKIVSIGFTEGFYYKPRVDYEILEKYHEGIIATSACLAGIIPRTLTMGMYDDAVKEAIRLRDIFGENNFFLELQDHGIAAQKQVNRQLIKMSDETGIPLICTNDVHYTYKEDADAHDILLCIQTQTTVNDENRMRYPGGQYYLKSPEEMADLFDYVPEALENTQKIADRCNVTIEFGVTKLPRFKYPDEFESSWDYINFLCDKGLKLRYGDKLNDETFKNEVTERLKYELEVIHNMGYVDYFLIVWDYINFAKEHNIPVGPGRGSAAGSIVSYTLFISDIDPIEYNLVFERFLNPERVSMPDIDTDFCYEGRDRVINYVIEKYGSECVSQIVTFGTMAARAVIKDVGRALDMPYAKRDMVAKMIPQTLGITIDKALEVNKDLKELYETDEEVTELIDRAKRLEGLPRHASVHASGILICDRPVDDYVPLAVGADNAVVAEFTMTTLERLGLLKMDFLGLRTLTVIRDAVNMINKKDPNFSIDKINYKDKKVFDYISTGKCEGIFQLESSGMKSFMKELMPRSLEDLIAGISLYRPGPMDFIPQYIKGKNNSNSIVYDSDKLEPILSSTYGCIVYQEQVMQIVRDLAGYSWGRSDLVRRAMSKKKSDVMEQECKNFIYGNEEEGVDGCIKRGVDEKTAGRIFDEMIDFAKYAFNKSHAACYAVITYRTAYLKTYYPVEFMAALMTSVIDNTDKVAGYMYSCQQMGIELKLPNVNESGEYFEADNGAINFALNEIKALGRPIIHRIVTERNLNGKYKSMADFVRRLCSDLNKRSLENLIKAGALDCFEGTRKAKLAIFDRMLDNANKQNKDSISGQMSLFDMMSQSDIEDSSFDMRVPEIPEMSLKELLDNEKEVLGIYVSGHPLDEYSKLFGRKTTAKAVDFAAGDGDGDENNAEDAGEEKKAKLPDGSKQTIGGIVIAMREITTKKGDQMCFVTLEDKTGAVEVVVFPRVFDKFRKILHNDAKLIISGKVSVDADSSSKLLAEDVMDIDEMQREVWIRFADEDAYLKAKERIIGINEQFTGNDILIVYCEQGKKMLVLSKEIVASDEYLRQMRELFGEKNVAVRIK